ncbi:MAG: orotidine-5'-phosphate decarboxylase [Desulfurobacteriaceae bacterium]
MIIVALDFDSKDKALNLVDTVKGKINHFKVGLELFSRCGTEIVREISSRGCKVFLDLKYHDIPNTVKSAARVAIESKVWMYNIHALGGFEFMKSVAEFNKEYAEKVGAPKPLLIAVTILTSMGNEDLKSIGIENEVETQVLKLAELAKKAGLNGVVCSAREVKKIKENLGSNFLTITPGIRPAWASKDDQKRIVTPKDAVKLGTDYMVIGRPITRAEDPREAAERILKEVNS